MRLSEIIICEKVVVNYVVRFNFCVAGNETTTVETCVRPDGWMFKQY